MYKNLLPFGKKRRRFEQMIMIVEYKNFAIKSSMAMQDCKIKSFYSLQIYAIFIERFSHKSEQIFGVNQRKTHGVGFQRWIRNSRQKKDWRPGFLVHVQIENVWVMI
jgi:hypothetical protein